MKSLIKELRLFISEKMLGWSFKLAPFGKEGEEIKVMIAYYFKSKVEGGNKCK